MSVTRRPVRSSGGTPVTVAERHVVLDIAARACSERGAQLIAGAGSNDTASTARELPDLAAWPEVSAALTVVPYYTTPPAASVSDKANAKLLAARLAATFATLRLMWPAPATAAGR